MARFQFSRKATWALVVWVGFWLTIFALTHTPVPRGIKVVRFTDKIFHFVVFAALTWLGARWRRLSKGAVGRIELLVWAGIYLIYAALDEWLQTFVRRGASLYDWIADAAGVLVMTAYLLSKNTRNHSARVP